MAVRDKVLDALLSTGEFISGESLSEQLGVSRTSIWKAIKKLKEDGFVIESVNNKGYRMVENPSGLSENLLSHDVRELGFTKVSVMDTIDSTNLEAKRLGESNNDTILVVSDEQTAGRGRRGRSWMSKKGDGLYFSMLLRPEISPMSASMLTLLAGLSVCKTVNEKYQTEAMIKWPNDIVIGGRKLCGVLTELSTEIDEINYVVVGIGINLFNKEFPEEISHMATSLTNEINESIIDKHVLIVDIITQFMTLLNTFVIEEDLSFIKDEYESLCANIGRELTIESRKDSYACIGVGVSRLGNLIVLKEDGTQLEVNSGEVSVKGIYDGKHI